MSNKGTNARERQLHGRRNFGMRAQELRVEQVPATGRSISPLSLDGTGGFGLEEVISNPIHHTASFAKRPQSIFEIDSGDSLVVTNPLLQQQEGPSATAIPQIIPSFGGELEKAFQVPTPKQEPIFYQSSKNTLHPEQLYQFGNMEVGPNYGGSFAVAPAAGQGTVTGLSSSNYLLPTSNFTPQLGIDSSNGGSFPVAPTAAQGTVTSLGSGNYHLPTSNLAPQLCKESAYGGSFPVTPPAAQGNMTSLGSGNYQLPASNLTPQLCQESSYGGSFPVTPPAAQGTVTSLGSGNYHLPILNLTPQMCIESSYGGSFPVAPPAAQGTMTSLGSGNYHLPTSNLTPQLSIESSSSVQLPPSQQSYQQNPLGVAIGAPSPSFPMTQWANNPNLQQSNSQLSTGLGATQEMIQSQGLSSFYPVAMSSNHQNQFPNTEQQKGFLGIQTTPNQHEMGDSSSSRNVKMKMGLSDNSQQQSAALQVGSLLDPPAQGSENPPPPPRPIQNSIYDPMYEALGFPVDPHLRMFLAAKRKKGNP